MYEACTVTISWTASAGNAAERTLRESAQAPGVSGWNGPPGPYLRSMYLATPSATVGTCGGLRVSK
ncbi:Uncharacterised protein [Mycobacteroides abscessus subsp. abscessus]|nr:Uncharacterised protein [Mycobacteroides abscessus subsp. abscessus]